MERRVDLPAPFGPMRASVSPPRTSRLVGASATCGPYRRATPRAERSVPFTVRPPWHGERERRPRRKACAPPGNAHRTSAGCKAAPCCVLGRPRLPRYAGSLRPCPACSSLAGGTGAPRGEALAMASRAPLYDREREMPANRGNVVDLWGVDEDWSFGTDGALALQPEPHEGLKAEVTSVTVPRMATPQATGLSVRARNRRRDEMRTKARRARRMAALIVVVCVSVVTLVLTAFGTGAPTRVAFTGPAPANRLLPAGPPQPQVVAMQDSLRIQLPVNQSRVTAIGYHASGTNTLPLQPVGSQANAGLFGRIVQRLFGQSGSGIRYYLIGGGVGPQTGGLHIRAPVQTDVYAPVDGTVIAISDQIVNGRAYGVRIDIQPSGDPDVVVALINLRPDPALTVGSTVSAGRTKIGRVIDLSSVEQAALARYTHDKGQHVHIEVHAASSLATP